MQWPAFRLWFSPRDAQAKPVFQGLRNLVALPGKLFIRDDSTSPTLSWSSSLLASLLYALTKVSVSKNVKGTLFASHAEMLLVSRGDHIRRRKKNKTLISSVKLNSDITMVVRRQSHTRMRQVSSLTTSFWWWLVSPKKPCPLDSIFVALATKILFLTRN